MRTACSLIAAVLTVSLVGCDEAIPPFLGYGAEASTGCATVGNTTGEPVACPNTSSNPTLPTLLPTCTLPDVPACTDARCVPLSLLPDGTEPSDLGDCDSNGTAGKCVPDFFVATQGEFLLSSCTAAGGVEGRCLSPCVLEVAENLDNLVEDVCQNGWLCAPCIDDQGLETGACAQGCDSDCDDGAGSVGGTDVSTPTSCCGELGLCLANDLVPEANRTQLGTLECSNGQLCVPTALASNTPASCTAFGALGAEGRCMPACLPDVAADAEMLDQGLCDAEYLCAPCYDPRTGAATGACTLNGDAPAEPAATFPPCCQGEGRCVPPSAAGEDAASLSAQDCAEGLLCAPEAAVNDPESFSFPVCTIPEKTVSLLGIAIPIAASSGACVPECFMADGDQVLLDLLELLFPSEAENPCAANETCAPCANPLSGEDTGACR